MGPRRSDEMLSIMQRQMGRVRVVTAAVAVTVLIGAGVPLSVDLARTDTATTITSGR